MRQFLTLDFRPITAGGIIPSDFEALDYFSILSIPSTGRDFLTYLFSSQYLDCIIRLLLTGSLAQMTSSVSCLISFTLKVTCPTLVRCL